MFKIFSTIKSFYKLAKVKPLLLFFMFLTLLVPAILSILTPILVSNTITALTVYDFNFAIKQTIFEFAILIVSAILYFIYHFISSKINKTIINNFQNYIYTNVKSNEKIKSINLSTIQDINNCTKFNKNLIYKSCFFIKSIIILIIIFNYSFYLSLAIVFVSIISFLLLRITNKKIQYKNQELSKYELESLGLFNSICSGENAEQNYNLEPALKDKYFKYVDENIKTTNSISLYYNINNNFISLILKTTTFLATIFLISGVKSTTITLSVYLILTPYLTSSAENLISFFDIFPEIAIMNNTLKEFDSLKYIKSKHLSVPIKINSYNLYFYNLTFNETYSPLNLKILYKKSVCFVSSDDKILKNLSTCFFNSQQISGGGIFLDEKNISNIAIETLNQTIANISTNEQFFNVSIFENLYFVCESKTKINAAIKEFFLQQSINELPDKLNTIINQNNSPKLCFFLGIIRGYLSGAKIINIVSVPENLTKEEKLIFKKMIIKLKTYCTVICYFNESKFNDLFDEIIDLDNFKNSNE